MCVEREKEGGEFLYLMSSVFRLASCARIGPRNQPRSNLKLDSALSE